MKSLVLLLASAGVALAAPAALQLPGAVTDADYRDGGAPSADMVELGRLLFFDRVLSGNRNISCATCHHPDQATSDGLALGFGEGATGLGPKRRPGTSLAGAVAERVPRNSPALFNLGAKEYTAMFHDGRVEEDPKGFYAGGFITPARFKLPVGLSDVLAAQAMFPVTSPTEMAGQKGENDVADQRALNNVSGKGGVWQLLAERLQAIPEYVESFERAFPEVERAEDITFVLAANAIAAFEASAFRSDQSPFDRHLRGEDLLSADAKAGMALFYGEAGCADCHSGKFQTDHGFHAVAMPQIGPGKADGRDASFWNGTGIQAFVEDFGRGRVTVRAKDNYRFRTPSLRNVELTGPYGHAGSYTSLEDVVRHHLDPVEALEDYEVPDGLLAPIGALVEVSARGDSMQQGFVTESRAARLAERDTWVQRTPGLRRAIREANELAARSLSEEQIDQLLAFLGALTDPSARELERLVPDRVPSGLPVRD